MKTFVAQTADQWRKWLDEHHDSESEVWLIFYKLHTGVESIAYLDALEDDGVAAGATATVSLSVVESGSPEHRLEIFGSKGALRIEESGELWHAKQGAGDWKRVETDRGPLAEGMREAGWSRGFTVFARAIVAALREGRNTIEGAADFEDGYRTQLVLDAARRSNESGQMEKV